MEFRIPLCEPHITGDEWAYVKECLDTGWVSSAGPYVDRFESEIADYVGVKHAVATVNGTAALHLALLVAGIEPNDEVILPALSFVAPANAVRYVSAHPVFVDVDPETWQIDTEFVSEFLERHCHRESGVLKNRTTGRRVSSILPVHILGLPSDLDSIMDLATEYSLAVIEDATESLGAEYKGRRVGCHGSLGCLSFNGNKLITSGGGGMVLTDRDDFAVRARHLSQQAKRTGVEYDHDEVGYNYRLSSLQAAVGVAQLARIEDFLRSKARIAGRYREEFGDQLPSQVAADGSSSANWLFTVLVDPEQRGETSREMMVRLRGESIETRPLWKPLPELSPFSSCYHTGFGQAQRLHRQCLSLPCSVWLSDTEQAHIIETIGV
ncbi:MAG: aminotransferase DegT [Gemmatimonadetes bacterium]|nr:aminotransferase DegT [Gemmatimonadota bacterium]|tara:strand:- start:4248 stop:5390 length:1143 start_codon:yes stop_codon:yes gene_type:complete